jgi:hypothetical protein
MSGLKSAGSLASFFNRLAVEKQNIGEQALIDDDIRNHSGHNQKRSEKNLAFRFYLRDLRITAMVEFSVHTRLSPCGESKRRHSAHPLCNAARRARSVNAFNRNITANSRRLDSSTD